MPSKDILSIHQFQITQEESEIQLFPRAYALPQFFTTSLVHDYRVVKMFMGQNALIKAFYFNYMKLALQSENSQEYLQLLKQQFVSFEHLQEGQLQDKFLSDFQYRKFFKDFIQLAKQQFTPDFEATAKRYPIIDQILQKLFKTVVPISLFFSQDEQTQVSDFQIANQVIEYLCEHFQEQYSISIHERCIKFEATDMYLYIENLNEVYIAYVDELMQGDEKINKFQSSAASSFVCGEGNSFTSKFKKSSQKKTKKHPFRQISVQSKSSGLNQKSFRNTESLYLLSGPFTNKQTSKEQDFFIESQAKVNLLQSKGSLIRRRSKNQQLNKENHKSLIEQPKSCFQYQEEISSRKEETSSDTPTNSGSKESDTQLTNTLINILDSRVSEIQQGPTVYLPSTLIEKTPQKGHMIMRRKSNKPQDSNSSQTNSQSQTDKDKIQQLQHTHETNKYQFTVETPIILPEPKEEVQQIRYTNSFSIYNPKTTFLKMEEITEIREDEDEQEIIQDFCEVQSRDVSQKTINLSDSISRRLKIQKVQSRNINISRTSIDQTLSSPNKKEIPSFFEFENNQRSNNSTPNKNLENSVDQRNNKTKIELQKKTFQQYMKQMKAKLPFKQQISNCKVQNFEFSFKKNSNIMKPIQNSQFSNEKNKNAGHLSNQSRWKSIAGESAVQEIKWTSPANDQFTKSDILLLLDEQYRAKIRAIKNEYKSAIHEEYNSMQKENLKSGIDHQTKSVVKQSQRRNTYNKEHQSPIMYNQGEMNSRSREPSIYVEQQ